MYKLKNSNGYSLQSNIISILNKLTIEERNRLHRVKIINYPAPRMKPIDFQMSFKEINKSNNVKEDQVNNSR
jgi:hypothetical protein